MNCKAVTLLKHLSYRYENHNKRYETDKKILTRLGGVNE